MDQDASQLEVHDVDAWSSSSMSNCSSLLLFACLSSLGVSPGLAISVPDGGSVDLKQNQLSGVTVSLTPQPNSLITALELSAQPLQLAQTPIDSSILDSVPNTNIRSEAVAEAQALLAQLGYYDGNIDGIYGVRTEAAVSKFQRDAGLPSDGQINQQTWQRLLATRDQAPPVLPDSSESASALSSEDGQISEAPPTDGPLKTSSEEISEDTTTTSSSNLNGNADPKDDVANRSVSVAADESASQGSEEDSSPETDLATPSSNPLSQRSWLQWLLLLIVGSIIGGGLYQAGRWRGKREKQQGGLFGGRSPLQHSSSHTSSAKSEAISTNSQSATVSKEASNGVTALSPHQSGNGESGNGESGNGESGNRGDDHPVEPGTPSDTSIVESHNGAGEVATSPLATDTIPIEATTRLAKVNIVQELVNDLHTPDSSKRRKAIWELGQRGSSEAIQPLSDLLIDSDSSQRSLILAAMSEIGMRSLKPLNRALIISMQDENPDVRKNAIRDITRVCDLVAQISQVLHHAAYDEDQEVQETAQWALKQIDRIRGSSDLDRLPASDASQSTSESLPSGSSDSSET